jgi:hypothetical protein
MDLMHGAHYAKQFVTDYLRSDLPSRLISYRNGWNLDDQLLPNPVKYLSYEPIALDEWPTIITVAISSSGYERIGHQGLHPEYRILYNMRTYVWVRDEGSEAVTIMRDRLTTVLRSALLDRPCLRAQDPRDSFQVMIEEGSVREEFSDLTLLKGDRVLAGAYVGYELYMNEIVAREDIGRVEAINVETTAFNPEQTIQL